MSVASPTLDVPLQTPVGAPAASPATTIAVSGRLRQEGVPNACRHWAVAMHLSIFIWLIISCIFLRD